MYSLLIPTYNYVCYELVETLYQQAERFAKPFEILVADDGSTDEIKEENRRMNYLANCRYIELPENVGRAKIRNILAASAQYEYLIFMDCDAMVHSSRFIENYMNVRHEAPVVCGGILHLDLYCNENNRLRFYYEKHAAARFTARERNKHPYQAFRTFNFMVRRDVILAFPFDERMVRYGHEDTLFGKRLEAENISILHIENPLVNADVETNDVFLRKTEVALESLCEHSDLLMGYSPMLKVYGWLKKLHVVGLVEVMLKKLLPFLRRNLLGRNPSVFIYGLYKLGYFCSYDRHK